MDWFLYDNGLRHEKVKHKTKRLKIPQKLRTKSFTYTKKFYVQEIATLDFSEIYFLKNTKKTCKLNNRDLKRD